MLKFLDLSGNECSCGRLETLHDLYFTLSKNITQGGGFTLLSKPCCASAFFLLYNMETGKILEEGQKVWWWTQSRTTTTQLIIRMIWVDFLTIPGFFVLENIHQKKHNSISKCLQVGVKIFIFLHFSRKKILILGAKLLSQPFAKLWPIW